jgi:SAM-dependent methyltransferase
MDVGHYYDDFAPRYEARRGFGYHKLIDDLEAGIAAEGLPAGGRALEVGCGTGLVLERLRARGAAVVGVDISRGMLALARGRELDVTRGDALALPFAEASFDLVCSFKVLAHIPRIEAALGELTRVLRPGGRLVVDFYNALSLRYLVKRVVGHRRTGRSVDEGDVTTRWDSAWRVAEYFPKDVVIEQMRGVRLVTPAAQALDAPLIGRALGRVERALSSRPALAPLGGFVVVVAKKL